MIEKFNDVLTNMIAAFVDKDQKDMGCPPATADSSISMLWP